MEGRSSSEDDEEDDQFEPEDEVRNLSLPKSGISKTGDLGTAERDTVGDPATREPGEPGERGRGEERGFGQGDIGDHLKSGDGPEEKT